MDWMYKEIGSEGTSWLYELSANETTYNISSPLLADFKYFGRWIVMNHRCFFWILQWTQSRMMDHMTSNILIYSMISQTQLEILKKKNCYLTSSPTRNLHSAHKEEEHISTTTSSLWFLHAILNGRLRLAKNMILSPLFLFCQLTGSKAVKLEFFLRGAESQ